jgi:hypothetical protein
MKKTFGWSLAAIWISSLSTPDARAADRPNVLFIVSVTEYRPAGRAWGAV